MNSDDIKRMAQEAGLVFGYPFMPEHLERFAELVAAEEREACAKMFDNVYEELGRMFHLDDPNHPSNTEDVRDAAAAAFYYAEDIRAMKHHRKSTIPTGNNA